MLDELVIAGHCNLMQRLFAALLLVAVCTVPVACRQQPQGALRAVVIGGEPKIRDPALGPLPPADAVLLQNIAQGLVRFDANGNIEAGLAERWNVSDDGLSYIFRLASMNWPDGKKITAQQVARLLKRQLAERSQNPLKDSLGVVDDVVAMTDRVIEIRLLAPRPNLLSLLAQPEFAILRDNAGTGPFQAAPMPNAPGELRLSRAIQDSDEEEPRREQVMLAGETVQSAIGEFGLAKADLVLGGTFLDLPYAQHAKIPGAALRFDPASGLFGLIPTNSAAPFDDPQFRYLLTQALDRNNLVSRFAVAGLAARATLLEPALDGIAPPTQPAWFATAFGDRLAALKVQIDKQFPKTKPVIRVALSEGPGADLLFDELQRDWGAIGLTVERSKTGEPADYVLIDEVAPSTSPSWYVRHFRCGAVAICDNRADQLMEVARQTPVPQQRYALLAQAASRIDEMQLFIPLAAPIRWSLVSTRIQGFAGNRYARHTLTDLEQQPGTGD